MRTVFKFVHPVLPIIAGLFMIAGILFHGQGGACAFPLILILPVLLLGVIIGLVLSGVRSFRYMCQKRAAHVESK